MVSLISSNASFRGVVRKYEHVSAALGGLKARFNVFLPFEALQGQKVPCLYYLSGLTCTEDNVMQKSGIQRDAAQHAMAVIAPDTSPRGAGVDGEDDGWDFGTGAGFYVDATDPKWAKHYRMYDYIVNELPGVVEAEIPALLPVRGITGHSMGGHGALQIFAKNPDRYVSVSAFAPISRPSACPWGEKALGGYLASKDEWAAYDACALLREHGAALQAALQASGGATILVDQGTDDQFYKEKQLLPEELQQAADDAGVPLTLRMQEGYDHSYYFVSTFVPDHVAHHAKAFAAKAGAPSSS